MTRYLHDAEAVRAAVERHTKRWYTVGLDLGQTTDPTAIAVIERLRVPQIGIGRLPDPIPYATTYVVRWLERVPLRTTYPEIIEIVRKLLHTAPLAGNSRLVIDMTGVGRPVYDLFVRAKLAPVGVTITAGDDWSRDVANYRVPKRVLASRIDAALNSRDLHIVPSLPDAEVLRQELADFQRKTTATGYTQFAAREGRHDDLVLAVAVALWYVQQIGNQVIGMADLHF